MFGRALPSSLLLKNTDVSGLHNTETARPDFLTGLSGRSSVLGNYPGATEERCSQRRLNSDDTRDGTRNSQTS